MVNTYQYLPGASQYLYVPDRLIAGDKKLVTATVMIDAGQVLVRGSILGRINLGSPIAAAAAGNKGNGTATAPALNGTAVAAGAYSFVATAANAFSVTDPTGRALPPLTVGLPYAGDLALTINAGSAAFQVGDSFAVTVTPGSLNWKLSSAGAFDGSQVPAAILVDSIDTTAGANTAGIYEEGEFNLRSVTFGPGHSQTTVSRPLRGFGIHLKAAVSGDPV